MAEELIFAEGSQEEKYITLLSQLKALIEDESDYVANFAIVCAALRQTFKFFWVGFYFVRKDELVLGPFQGDIACTRIQLGKGVCGKSWELKESIIVDDVDQFPGHIACSSAGRSEIVVPLIHENKVIGILDVDSDRLADFNEVDKIYLEKIALLLSEFKIA